MNTRRLLFLLLLAVGITGPVFAQLLDDAEGWDEARAIDHSQAVLGTKPGDYAFTRIDGSSVSLSDYAGKPLLISMVFTSCHHVCPATTKRLRDAVQAARDVMEPGSFRVVTIGFDTVNDTPAAMQSFARQQSIDDADWDFLSGDFESVDALAADLGFIYYRSPSGFDHITQVSVLNAGGEVFSQVYGVNFELPWLVEPLKVLVFKQPGRSLNPVAGLMGRIRLFCTVYDPARDRYHFDYSLFIQMAIGLAAIIGVGLFLFLGLRRPGTG